MLKFEDIVGQEEIVSFFRRSIRQNKISHAILISGEKHTGKKFMARIFASALCCERGGENPCGECRSCKMAETENHPDIVPVLHEKPTSFGVNDVRKGINDDIVIKPYQTNRKIYIVPDASMMTPGAQNALLKTLEEPPSYAVIILLADNRETLLPTILSRCICLSVKPVPNGTLRGILREKGKLSEGDMDLAVAFARGSIGRAELLSESEEFSECLRECVRLLSRMERLSSSDERTFLKLIADNKGKEADYLDFFRVWFRDVLYYKATEDAEGLTFSHGRREIMRYAGKLSYEELRKTVDYIEEIQASLRAGVSPGLSFELLIDLVRDALTDMKV
ncbi:MAG: DNA polymerase III subunit [Lachnospiraceae bacterium]|nr:DNA polymerase III subunit [Lachnospiraceae bacterium]